MLAVADWVGLAPGVLWREVLEAASCGLLERRQLEVACRLAADWTGTLAGLCDAARLIEGAACA